MMTATTGVGGVGKENSSNCWLWTKATSWLTWRASINKSSWSF